MLQFFWRAIFQYIPCMIFDPEMLLLEIHPDYHTNTHRHIYKYNQWNVILGKTTNNNLNVHQ